MGQEGEQWERRVAEGQAWGSVISAERRGQCDRRTPGRSLKLLRRWALCILQEPGICSLPYLYATGREQAQGRNSLLPYPAGWQEQSGGKKQESGGRAGRRS